ncbi:FAD-dependent oxidoreductase [Vallitalea guaymasensis]|uniref:FAD-dependent oxidoreductase n=1 Tax=Vallitalea guaymasensis TaxID=1185412 RepID=UPI001FD435BF|nr:FAD-dependent oxidoreductase [Vallitalea guaymasensis]
MIIEADYIILGAGMYGLYASKDLVDKGNKVVILEHDCNSFQRASYINQARVHRGYHYPRSYATAIKSADYFKRFYMDFEFAINNRYKSIYGIAENYSLTSAKQFKSFCKKADIPCTEVYTNQYFKKNLVEQAFLTEEYALDAGTINEWFMEKLNENKKCKICYDIRIREVSIKGGKYVIRTEDGNIFMASTVINTTYASVNQILRQFQAPLFKIRYEISEIIICKIKENYSELGLTLMDGPFFSIMPFGNGNYHSLTSVTFTHHKTCNEILPHFPCQERNKKCTLYNLENCNLCDERPKTFFHSMKQLANKYLAMDMNITYIKSLFAIKPLLDVSEMDDSRPTVIKVWGKEPRLITVLSGKINTVYDLEKVIG